MDTRPFGIDVASYDGLIKWDAVVTHDPIVHFMFFRTGISWAYKDAFFSANWKAAIGKVLRGAYHVVYPGESAIKQYDNTMAMLSGDIGDFGVVIDAELDHGYTKSVITKTIREFTDKLFAATGKQVGIYSRANWIDQFLDVTVFPDVYWFLANYLAKPWYQKYANEHPGPPLLPKGVSTYTFHQTGTLAPFCAGTTKAVQDYDRFNGSVEDLYKFASVSVPVEPTDFEGRLKKVEDDLAVTRRELDHFENVARGNGWTV